MSIRKYDSQQQYGSGFNVFIRVRPYNQQQLVTESPNTNNSYLTYNESQIFLKLKTQIQCFTFDRIYSPSTIQQQIFSSIAEDIIDNAFIGINGTIFCYGQTSSGKTYTIIGDSHLEDSSNQGLLPRIIRDVIRRKNEEISKQSNIDIRIKISMVEIYNEKVIDLLDLDKRDLKLRENKKQGVFIQFVTQKYVVTASEAMIFVKLGLQNRTVGKTNMNEYSSRSHMVFIITVHETNFHTREARSAKITLTDLAGNEKISKTGVQGKMLIETKKINTSLSTLGKVIQALSENKTSHIPYRDSKLTRLLQESIGGNSLTRLIINVSPSQTNQYETLTSLRFGSRAKLIKNKPKANKQYTMEQLLMFLEKAELKIKQQMKVIGQLKQGNISRFERRNGGYSGLVGLERAITMHMIGDEDEHCEETQSMSNQSKLIVKSTVSNRDKYNVSMFGDIEMVDIDDQSLSEKEIRKPTLSLSKSLKVLSTLELEGKDLDLDTLNQKRDKYTSIKKKSQKSVRIVDWSGFDEQKEHNQNFQLELNSIKVELHSAVSKADEMQSKLLQNIAIIEEQKEKIKKKDQQIAQLKEKYKTKKSQINREINKLKSFWLDLP